MKIYAIILLCALIYSVRGDAKKGMEALKAVVNECKEKHGATENDAAAAFKYEPAANTVAKCMRACILKTLGLQNDDGKLVFEEKIKFLKDMLHDNPDKLALAEEMVTVCHDIKVSKDHCEAAEEYMMCTKRESDKIGLKFF